MIVAVHPLAGFDKVLHYRAPATLQAGIAVGSLVRVPMLNRFTLGVVSQLNPVPDCPVENLKNVAQRPIWLYSGILDWQLAGELSKGASK